MLFNLAAKRVSGAFPYAGIAIAAALLCVAAPSQAIPIGPAGFIMTLDDTSTTGIDVIIVDDAAIGTSTTKGASTHEDGAPASAGFVTFNGTVGSFSINVTTGISKPNLNPPQLHLDSVNVTGSSAGTIEIMLTDLGYTTPEPGVSRLRSQFSTTTDGTVHYWQYADPDNTEFSTSSNAVFVAGGPFEHGSFAETKLKQLTLTGPYSLTEVVRISHAQGGLVTSLDLESQVLAGPIPEPATIALFAAGGACMMPLSRRRRHR